MILSMASTIIVHLIIAALAIVTATLLAVEHVGEKRRQLNAVLWQYAAGSTWDDMRTMPQPRSTARVVSVIARGYRPPVPRWRRILRRVLWGVQPQVEPPWSPFAEDGKLRPDLFPTEGFYPMGALQGNRP